MTITERIDAYCQCYYFENYGDAQIFIEGILAGLALAGEFANPVEIVAIGPFRDNTHKSKEWAVELTAE